VQIFLYGPVKCVSVSLVVHRNEVHHQHVLGVQVQAAQLHLERGEHPPAGFGDDHLGAKGVELVPEMLHLEDGAGVRQGRRDGTGCQAAATDWCQTHDPYEDVYANGTRGFF
jgi:hypothetical protein